MTWQSIALASALSVWSVVIAKPASAECVTQTAKIVLESKLNELVFRARVTEITRTAELGYRTTFDVERVWKGSVSKRVDLYVWELAPEVPRFEVGHTYVAVAKRLADAKTREGVGLGQIGAIAFTPVGCSDMPSLAPNIEEELGIGKPPK